MFFSVIIPLYNKEAFIASAINSVLSQSFQDFEIIVVDDGSTDHSLERVNEIRDARLRVISTPNQGPAAARNLGISHIRGNWIIFLDADDRLAQNALSLFHQAIEDQPSCDVFYATTLFFKNGVFQSSFPRDSKEGRVYNPAKEAFFRRLSTAAGSACFNRKVFSDILFNAAYTRGEDVDFHARVWKKYACYRCNEPTVIVNVTSRQASKPLENLKRDYTAQVCLQGTRFWERMYLYELYLGAKNTYPNMTDRYGRRYVLLFLNRLLLHKW